ncbi:hypothetical protein [Sphingomonas sp.]|uniref:hypothetical protein n=1 Tax=Sphingomonas sp. TaxID=28214 RepID=UPI003AFFCFAB
MLGRRPAMVKWTPSKPLPWWLGGWREGHDFTIEQEERLIQLGRDPVTAERMTVRREQDLYTEGAPNLNTWIPIYEFACPVLARRADDKVTIIAPDGTTKHIRADGWAAKPSSYPYRGSVGFG